MRRILFLVIFGLGGASILIGLGVWQMQRLAWKEGVLTQIEERIAADPTALPASFEPDEDRFAPGKTAGTFEDRTLRVLISVKREGPGHRLISSFVTSDGRRILVDRGWVSVEDDIPPVPTEVAEVIGNLHWPRETDSFTPDPNLETNTWFARDVPRMAEVLDTEHVMIVVREASYSDPSVTPLPVDTAGIPNDHLQYAITWFSLALIWVTMTGFFLLRSRSAST